MVAVDGKIRREKARCLGNYEWGGRLARFFGRRNCGGAAPQLGKEPRKFELMRAEISPGWQI
jgi:hypothetical protein